MNKPNVYHSLSFILKRLSCTLHLIKHQDQLTLCTQTCKKNCWWKTTNTEFMTKMTTHMQLTLPLFFPQRICVVDTKPCLHATCKAPCKRKNREFYTATQEDLSLKKKCVFFILSVGCQTQKNRDYKMVLLLWGTEKYCEGMNPDGTLQNTT